MASRLPSARDGGRRSSGCSHMAAPDFLSGKDPRISCNTACLRRRWAGEFWPGGGRVPDSVPVLHALHGFCRIACRRRQHRCQLGTGGRGRGARRERPHHVARVSPGLPDILVGLGHAGGRVRHVVGGGGRRRWSDPSHDGAVLLTFETTRQRSRFSRCPARKGNRRAPPDPIAAGRGEFVLGDANQYAARIVHGLERRGADCPLEPVRDNPLWPYRRGNSIQVRRKLGPRRGT